MANKTISQFTELTNYEYESGDKLLLERGNYYYSINPRTLTGGLIRVKKTITQAQMQALLTTPVVLLAAQGAGTVIVPVEISVYLDHNGTNYGTATLLRTFPSGSVNYNMVTSSAFVQSASDRYERMFEGSVQRLGANTDYVIGSDGDASNNGGTVYVNGLFRVVTFG
jgi:hypothetical protein